MKLKTIEGIRLCADHAVDFTRPESKARSLSTLDVSSEDRAPGGRGGRRSLSSATAAVSSAAKLFLKEADGLRGLVFGQIACRKGRKVVAWDLSCLNHFVGNF